MSEFDETKEMPKCPTCGALMIIPEETFLCMTALAQSYQDEGGEWRRVDESQHPLRPEEVAYLNAHGVNRQFI